MVTPRVRPDLIVTAEWVYEHLNQDGFRIIDARAPVHFDGVQPTYLHREPVRKGHIPGATNVPFNEIVDDQLRIKPPQELARIFRDAVTLAEWIRGGEEPLILDLQEESASVRFSIPTAEHRTYGQLSDIPPDSGRVLVLYDGGEGNAVRAWLLLRRLGHPPPDSRSSAEDAVQLLSRRGCY